MRDIELFAKRALEAAVKVGVPQGIGGVADAIEKPEFAVAVGLAKLAAEQGPVPTAASKKSKKLPKLPKAPNFLKKILAKF